VVAERLVKPGQLADRPIDLIGLRTGWIIEEGEVGLD
jgi:hypothetical protein